MSYLSEEEFDEIANTVSIYPIGSKSIGDISQYSFDCGKAEEYVHFLKVNAPLLEKLCITRTFVIIHNETNELIGYFSLSADTIRLTKEEKDESNLNEVTFMALPAIKLGKLAINKNLSDKARRKGYGSFVIDIATSYAYDVLECGVACRFITVDADIEYYPNTPEFYKKNGFVNNDTKPPKKNAKTISMRRDIFYI